MKKGIRVCLLFIAGVLFSFALCPCVKIASASDASRTGYARIYESKTGLVCAPTVLFEVKGEADFSILEKERLPSTILLSVDDELNVIGRETRLCTLSEAADRIGKKCALAVYLPDGNAAKAFSEWCTVEKAQDVFAVSDNAETLKTAVSGWKYLLGILDLRKSAGTVETACANVQSAGARIILVKRDSFDYGQVRRLKALQTAVWTEAEQAEEVIGALTGNYTGILTSSPDTVYDVYEKFDKKTLYDTSIFVGHRGSAGTYPENSKEAALYAVEQGADCIEYDIHLTKDNHVVIMHDEEIGTTTNGAGKVPQMTLDEIRKYHLVAKNGETAQIPTLTDMLNAFRDSNVVHYIEYKVNNPALVSYVKEIVESTRMVGKVVFISFYSEMLKYSRQSMPQIPVGQLYGNYDTRDYYGSLEKTIGEFSALGKSNHCVYSRLYRQYIETARHRGIGVNGWTFVSEEYYKYFLYDMGSLTVDRPEAIGDLPLRVSASDINAAEGEPFSAMGEILTATKRFDGECSLIFLDGGENFSFADGKWTAKESGVYEALLTYEYDGTYCVLSNVIRINVRKSEKPPVGDDSQSPDPDSSATITSENGSQNGCKSSFRIGGACSVGALSFLILRKRKTKGNS